MKKVKFEELGKIIKKEAEKEFGGWYSDDIDDYMDEVTTEFIEEMGNNKTRNKQYIEITKVGKAPLIIEWEVVWGFDEYDMIESEEYYVY